VSVCPKAPCDRYDRVVLTGKANELWLKPAPVGIRCAIHSVLFQGILCLFRVPQFSTARNIFSEVSNKQQESEKALGGRESIGRARKHWEGEKALGGRGSCRAADELAPQERRPPDQCTVALPINAPSPSRSMHRRPPDQRTVALPINAPSPSRSTHRRPPDQRTVALPINAPSPSRPTHRRPPDQRIVALPINAPSPSRSTHRRPPDQRIAPPDPDSPIP
jgi:hypothetical protein